MKDLVEITSAEAGTGAWAVTGETGGTYVFGVRLDPEHPVFRGHFPGKPILPGVCSLAIIRECAARAAGVALKFSSIRESKFLSAVLPTAQLTVELNLVQDADKTYAVDATLSEGETVMLKLKAIIEKDE
jgi:3-hydroxyacyl-[acyl-carrier-protein] dehydratase